MNDPEPKITVESLLRLKRAERPPQEFWARFESDMRAKQLAAIVVRRPWWDGASRIFAVVRRNQLPFGAAAALALTWAGVHYVGGAQPAVRAVPASGAEPVAAANVPAPAAPAVTRAALAEENDGMDAPEAAPARQIVVASTTSHITQAPEAAHGESVTRSPFTDGISVTLADFRETQSEIAKRSVFGSDQEFEASVASARQPVAEPLARVDPSGERLERLLAPALPPYSATGARSFAGDRMKQKAADDRMYESMDRYGTGGMSLEFRF
jgi:hypothetical protein